MPERRYSELIQFDTFEDRFHYLQLHGVVANETFGWDRYLNQRFYKSKEWKRIRDYVIMRDNGCDLGCQDCPINGPVYIHHMNPMTIEDIENNPEKLLDPEYLISVSFDTHNALHYGDANTSKKYTVVERQPNDTTPWK